jgi:type IV pilus assembly protein PilW
MGFASSSITYTITTPSVSANMPTPNLTLYRNTNNTTNPLIEGIQDMQILYGADTDADGAANYYVPAGTAGLIMEQVVSIRISLLVFTLDDHLTTQPMVYTYNGVTTTPIDHRIRRVFNATIAVRNRLK